jgi:hypothetical protein
MTIKQAPRKKAFKSQETRDLVGHPVCIVLHDGSYYVGTVKDMNKSRLILSGTKGKGKINKASRSKVRVSGLFGHLFGGGGFNALAGNAAGAGGFNPLAGNAAGAGGFNPLAGNAAGAGGFNPFGANAVAAEQPGAGGIGGIFGKVKQMWPTITFGMNMVKQIMPLMGLFKR